MADDQQSLLLLDDDTILENIIARLDNAADLGLACKRLCRLVYISVEAVQLDETTTARLAGLPAWCTYAGCKGVCYFVQDTDDSSLPGLSAAVAHMAQLWPSLSELAVAVLPSLEVNAASRPANDAVLHQLPQFSAISSLQHLQLYKTAPLVNDAVQLACLTQLTSLMLIDRSYITGPEAMLQVDLWPLAGLTNLRGLAVAGVCPLGQQQGGSAGQPGTDASDSSSCMNDTATCLPTSLTSLVLKRYDELGLQLWLPHIWPLISLQSLQVLSYQEPRPRPAHTAFPGPLLDQLAHMLPNLQDLALGLDGGCGVGRLPAGTHCVLPTSISKLQQLSSLELGWCHMGVDTTAQWATLSELTELTCLRGLCPLVGPPTSYQLPTIQALSIDTGNLWVQGKGLSLPTTFPAICELKLVARNARQWLSVARSIAECSKLTMLGLCLPFTADIDCLERLRGLSSSLPKLARLAVEWGGDLAGGPLPNLSTFTQIYELSWTLLSSDWYFNMPGRLDPGCISDARVLASLQPLTQLTKLQMSGFNAITPAVVLGVQALMPGLVSLTFVHCSHELHLLQESSEYLPEDSDAAAVQAVLRKGLKLQVYTNHEQYERSCHCFPFSVQHVDAHLHWL